MDITPRYLAKEALREILDEQGRKASWLAHRLGVSKALMSLVLSRQRTLGLQEAQRIADLLGRSFFVLFELAEAREVVSQAESVA